MATVNLGNIKLNWKGAYNAGTAYIVDDVVSYNGSSYVCIQASTGNLPTSSGIKPKFFTSVALMYCNSDSESTSG